MKEEADEGWLEVALGSKKETVERCWVLLGGKKSHWRW